jgi:hypothetical protein
MLFGFKIVNNTRSGNVLGPGPHSLTELTEGDHSSSSEH